MRSAASDLGLHCLPMSLLWDARHKWVKYLISVEIENSGSCIRYRAMWRRLVNDHQVRVSRYKVLQIMHELIQKEFVDKKSIGWFGRDIMPVIQTMFGMLTGTIS